MEIAEIIAIVSQHCDGFISLEDEIIKKESLVTFLKSKEISEKYVSAFIDLIFDESEKDRENIPKHNLLNKYKLLLNLISEDSNENSIERSFNNKALLSNDSMICLDEAAQSGINSIDPQELSHNFNFSKSDCESLTNNLLIKSPSIIRPINTLDIFKSYKKEDYLQNIFTDRIENKNPMYKLKNSLDNMLESCNEKRNFNKKIQEVLSEINKPVEKFRPKKEYKRMFTSLNLNENFVPLNTVNENKEDYFLNLCKSIHLESKYNKNLRRVSDRIIKMNNKDIFTNRDHSSSKNVSNFEFNLKESIDFNNKNFLLLETKLEGLNRKITSNYNSANINPLLSNRASPVDQIKVKSYNLTEEILAPQLDNSL